MGHLLRVIVDETFLDFAAVAFLEGLSECEAELDEFLLEDCFSHFLRVTRNDFIVAAEVPAEPSIG